MKSSIDELENFNLQQRMHEILVQKLAMELVSELITEAIEHDLSKWSKEEYETFVDCRSSINSSQDGKDADYQNGLRLASIQKHIHSNKHHPEHWKPGEMPLVQAIIMYMDWKSRSIQRGMCMDKFWDYNIEKLKEQPHALSVVEMLRKRDEENGTWKRL